MTIQEAIKAAQDAFPSMPCITRQSWRRWSKTPGGVKIQPTDSPDGCIIESDVDKENRRRWNPTAADLLADDWVPTRL